MSRIGKQPIPVPTGVEVRVQPQDRMITVKGGNGNLSFTWRPEVDVQVDDDAKAIVCRIASDGDQGRVSRSLWGTTRSRIQNMVTGVTTGFTRKLNIVGVGWNAQAQGQKLVLNIGYCHPVEVQAPDGVTCSVEKNTAITVTGADKQAVGQFAAVVRSKRKPEPYNGKGILYNDEVIIRKQGKAFGA